LTLPEPDPDAGPGAMETCNGLDDDGDDRVDEDIPPIRCGVGDCTREVPGCADGVPGSCVPGRPGPQERCGGGDEDCDGAVDEDLGVEEAGAPIVIRDREGSTGDCTSCNWAFSPVIWPTTDGLLAIWRLGFLGTRPAPNVLARRLDDSGVPAGPVFTVFDTNATRGPRAAPLPEAAGGEPRLALTFCGRFGTDDRAASAVVDAAGSVLLSPTARSPTRFGCGAGEPDVAATGSRLAFAWTDNVAPDNEVLFDLATTRGVSVGGGSILAEEGRFSPRLATAGNRIGLALPVVPAASPDPGVRIAFEVRGTDGQPVAERASFPLTTPSGDPVFTIRHAVASADGETFLWIGWPSSPAPETPFRWVARFTTDGQVVSPPSLSTTIDAPAAVDLVPFGAEGFLAVVSRLDGAGALGRAATVLGPDGAEGVRWTSPTEAEAGFVDLDVSVDDEGRTFLIYLQGPGRDGEPNTVRVQELTCVDEPLG